MKYKLNKAHVDIVEGNFGDDILLTLPYGFRFSDDIVHVRGFDSIKELRDAVKHDVIPCDCHECVKNK